MAVAIATVRPRPGPALRRRRIPVNALVLSLVLHGALVAAVIVGGHVWRATQPKTYVVNLVPAVAAIGSPTAPRPTPAPALPDREPASPERPESRPTELPDRTPAPRESVALPDRSLPDRSLPDRSLPPRTPTLPRPGEKELPRVASSTPPAPSTAPVTRATPPAPPAPRGLPTGSPQGVGAVTLNAADFPFAYYLRQVQNKIGERWDPVARDGAQPQVVFEIARDGKIAGLKVEKSSGNPLYDQAALRAVNEATPFPPLPEDFKETFLRVHLGFNYSGTRG